MLVVFDDFDSLGAHEEVTSSEPSTSTRSVTPSVSELQRSLVQIGPLQIGARQKKRRGGPKSMKSMILTTPEKRAEFKEKTDRKAAKIAKKATAATAKAAKIAKKSTAATVKAAKIAKKSTAASAKGTAKRTKPDANKANENKNKKAASKRNKKPSTSSSEDVDFCMAKGCGELLDTPMTQFNTIECNKCGRPYHLRCVTMRSYFTCDNCNSDLDVSDEE